MPKKKRGNTFVLKEREYKKKMEVRK